MAKIILEIVTAERVVYSDEVSIVIAPGVLGQFTVLPSHAHLMTMLDPGELIVRKGNQEDSMFVSGGFLEVMNNRVTVLADTAERAEEIDTERAQAAKRRAEDQLSERQPHDLDVEMAEAALTRSLVRLKLAEKIGARRRKPGV